MNWTVVQRILGLLLMVFSITMLPPILVSIWYADQAWLSFIEGFALTLVAGIVCWLPVRRDKREMRLRDGFVVVAAFWLVLGCFGAAPLIFSTRRLPGGRFILDRARDVRRGAAVFR